jgi:hypothetical protein
MALGETVELAGNVARIRDAEGPSGLRLVGEETSPSRHSPI